MRRLAAIFLGLRACVSATTLPLAAAAILTALFVSGCENPDRPGPVPTFSSLTPQQQVLIERNFIAAGFTPEMVRLSLGKPDVITKDLLSETWTYTALSNRREPIFRDLNGRPVPPVPVSTTSGSDNTSEPTGFHVRFFDGKVISAE
jgi:hypothetical protein